MPNKNLLCKSFKIVTGIILLIYLSLFNFNSVNVIIASERKINVEVDRILVNFDIQEPIIMGEITMVPLRNVFEQMGFTVTWEGKTKTATLTKGDTITIKVNESLLTLNGKRLAISTPAMLMNEKLMLPLRAIAEASGATVGWDDKTSLVTITSKGIQSQSQSQLAEQDRLNNTGTWKPTDGFHIPGYTKSFFIGQSRVELEKQLGTPYKVTEVGRNFECAYGSEENKIVITFTDNTFTEAKGFVTNVPGATAGNYTVGEKYPTRFKQISPNEFILIDDKEIMGRLPKGFIGSWIRPNMNHFDYLDATWTAPMTNRNQGFLTYYFTKGSGRYHVTWISEGSKPPAPQKKICFISVSAYN